MPMFDPDKTYELHGAGRIPFPEPLQFPGGVFGGPPLPIERAGIFKCHWALPSDQWHDVTIEGPLFSPHCPADYAIRPSGAPVIGFAGGHLGDNGGATAGFDVGGALTGAALGAGVGGLMSKGGKKKRITGAVVGGLAGLAGQAIGSALFRPTILVLGLALLGGYAGVKASEALK